MHPRLTMIALVLGATLAAALALGAALMLGRHDTTAKPPMAGIAERGRTALPGAQPAPNGAPRSPQAPVDLETLKHGSQEPLVPPEIRVDVELAPGSITTAEPLVPKVHELPRVTLAPGSTATAEPLVPPVVAASAAPVVSAP